MSIASVTVMRLICDYFIFQYEYFLPQIIPWKFRHATFKRVPSHYVHFL
jgi:hypothetical protein